MKFYDDREVKSLLKTARGLGGKFYPLYYLAIHTGMRQAELIGLKWEDIDWSLSTLQVKRQVRHFTGASYAFLEPKSRSGTRTIILGKQALNSKKQKRARELIILLVKLDNLGLVSFWRWYTLTASNIRRDFRQLLVWITQNSLSRFETYRCLFDVESWNSGFDRFQKVGTFQT
jgi:integrase